MIQTKFNFFTVYLKGFVLSALLLVGFYFVAHPAIRVKDRAGGMNSVAGPCLAIMVCIGFMLYLLLKRTVILTADARRLSLHSIFGRHTIERSEIGAIYLTRIKRGLSTNDRGEALTIETKDEQSFLLPDNYYRNMPEIRQFLSDRYDSLVFRPKLESTADSAGNYFGQEDMTFSGNYATSSVGIGFYVSIFAFACGGIMVYTIGTPAMAGMFLLLLLLPYRLAGSELFYFRIKKGRLEIKNHLWPWINKSYPLPSIESVNFEKAYKTSNRLCVRTKDFNAISYGAGSLRKENWAELASTLKEINIPVFNDFPLD